MKEDLISKPQEEMKAISRRSFLWGAVAVGSAFGILKWIDSQPKAGGLVRLLRTGLEANQGFIENTYGLGKLSRTFEPSQIEPLRVNGRFGLVQDIPPPSYTVKLVAPGLEREVPLRQILELPQHEYITELRCVEGWSRIFRWKGCRISDFLEVFAPGIESKFMSMETPYGGYYVGLDRASFMHPQALLCSEMNGQPLLPLHGAPLRLAMPTKYGYKQLKRIGNITLTDHIPRDDWAERGFDWFAAL